MVNYTYNMAVSHITLSNLIDMALQLLLYLYYSLGTYVQLTYYTLMYLMSIASFVMGSVS